MPKSKRNRIVTVSATKSKGIELKSDLVKQIKDSVDEYSNLFVFTVQNMRNAKLKDVRNEWSHSRFYFGRNKIMAKAIGDTVETEVAENIHKVSKQIVGDVGLLFTNKTLEEVTEWFDQYSQSDYARAGCVADREFVIKAGDLSQFPHNMEPQLRSLGLKTSMKKGVVTLDEDYVVCKFGQTLSPEQCRLLKLFAVEMVQFQITLKCHWNREGKFALLDSAQ
ncbi:mRNA turnover protein 4 [Sphaeroforma arctica JP610]|uniref:Ribosome assembly factor mrt4 n=1 Tax=Sphaeroforma arctica JP610 TaxID=667725 RepID=A0A0L0FWX0_9EUKA|nr:mRNA turnover protein 4 [Sphaeroforma arctica JP610]KNC81327.1 mRNA turnover protein 4 [Sphaeroforma arctica JP610]|eukprot:XP_014155229.1 mRNA turnover protein 4 [Sphaeroforma arctica JP610]